MVQRLYLPDERRCFEKEEDAFLNSSKACDSLRYFRADSFIAATEMMIKVVKISDDRRSDLVALAELAELTAFCVYDMYGQRTQIIPMSVNQVLYTRLRRIYCKRSIDFKNGRWFINVRSRSLRLNSNLISRSESNTRIQIKSH